MKRLLFCSLALSCVTACPSRSSTDPADAGGILQGGVKSPSNAAASAPASQPGASVAASTKTADRKPPIPTCAGGLVLVTEDLNPITPRCAARCKVDSNCPGGACTDNVALRPDGQPIDDPPTIKACVVSEP